MDNDITPEHAARPHGATAGWWDGLRAYGPGYDPTGTLYVLTADQWRNGDHPPARCRCGHSSRLTLLWLDSRPELARMWCPGCHNAWTDPTWTSVDTIRKALDQQPEPRQHPDDPRTPADLHPSLAYQTEMIRREAGNTRPKGA